MAKQNVRFVCSNCGAISSAWSGRCVQCGEWNTISEEAVLVASTVQGHAGSGSILKPQAIENSLRNNDKRLHTGIIDVDTVLGGGIVAGSVDLIAGQPGIGKSTLLLQLANKVATNNKVLYISGEESEHQVGLRAKRLGTESNHLQLVASTNADDIAATIFSKNYDLVVVDSIQTMSMQSVASAPGSVSQITNEHHYSWLLRSNQIRQLLSWVM